jgi:hypothetical protein
MSKGRGPAGSHGMAADQRSQETPHGSTGRRVHLVGSSRDRFPRAFGLRWWKAVLLQIVVISFAILASLSGLLIFADAPPSFWLGYIVLLVSGLAFFSLVAFTILLAPGTMNRFFRSSLTVNGEIENLKRLRSKANAASHPLLTGEIDALIATVQQVLVGSSTANSDAVRIEDSAARLSRTLADAVSDDSLDPNAIAELNNLDVLLASRVEDYRRRQKRLHREFSFFVGPAHLEKRVRRARLAYLFNLPLGRESAENFAAARLIGRLERVVSVAKLRASTAISGSPEDLNGA